MTDIDRRGSIAAYRRALELNPKMRRARRRLAYQLGRVGEHESALAMIRELIASQPNKLRDQFVLAQIHEMARNWSAMVPILKSYLNQRDSDGTAHQMLGTAHYVLGRVALAKHSYQRAVEVRPDLPEAWASLAMVLAHDRPTEEALRCFRKAIALRPTLGIAHWNLGVEFELMHRYREAAASLARGRRDLQALVGSWRRALAAAELTTPAVQAQIAKFRAHSAAAAVRDHDLWREFDGELKALARDFSPKK